MRLAILDLYDGTPNQGMRCIKEIVESHPANFEWKVYDVRSKCEVPDLSYDIYISTGGPGSPLDGDGIWDKKYYQWLGDLAAYNAQPNYPKKYGLFICHSFQMASNFFKLGALTKRKSMSFGTFPTHKTAAGQHETIFEGLDDIFYVADFREWQLIHPNQAIFNEMGASILALEKERPNLGLERAIMAIRYSEQLIGVQFHPEADPDGMIKHFQEESRQKHIIETYGKEKLEEMIRHLSEEEKIPLTHDVVIPSFLNDAVSKIKALTLVH